MQVALCTITILVVRDVALYIHGSDATDIDHAPDGRVEIKEIVALVLAKQVMRRAVAREMYLLGVQVSVQDANVHGLFNLT